MAVQEFHKDWRYHLRLLAREVTTVIPGAFLTPAQADLAYLRLDATNDPVTGDLQVGSATDISPSAGGAGQLGIRGAGYTGFIAMDATAMHVGHNSSGRDLRFMVNEITRLDISSSGGNVFFSPGGAAAAFTLGVSDHFVNIVTEDNDDILEFSLGVNEGVNGRRARFFLDDTAGTFGLQASASSGIPEFNLVIGSTVEMSVDNAEARFNVPVVMVDDGTLTETIIHEASGADYTVDVNTASYDMLYRVAGNRRVDFGQNTASTTLGLHQAGASEVRVAFLNSSAVGIGFWRITAGGTCNFRNQVHGGTIIIEGEDVGGTVRTGINFDPDNDVGLFFAGVEEVQTDNSDASDAITGLSVRHFDQTFYPVGVAPLPHVNISASTILSDTHQLKSLRWTGGAAGLDVTFNNDATMRVNTWGMIHNKSGSSKDLVEGTGVTLFEYDAAGGRTGDRTLADGSTATWWKITDTLYELWGNGLG